jgi:hypothetical protein
MVDNAQERQRLSGRATVRAFTLRGSIELGGCVSVRPFSSNEGETQCTRS